MRLPFIWRIGDTQSSIVDDRGLRVDYRFLSSRATEVAYRLPKRKCLVFVYTKNDINTLTVILGALASAHAVALLDPALPLAAKLELEQQYRPDVIYRDDEWQIVNSPPKEIHKDVALLLSTSGSTGGAKFVRLSLKNIEENASSIADSLDIQSADVAAAHLPLHYSYGLSVVLSHLVRGASLVLTSHGFLDRAFWPLMASEGVTHLPGVPFHYEMLARLGLDRLGLRSLRSLTQAGGHLALSLRRAAYESMERIGGRFYVMYGQTEASPRMATLHHADFPDHPESVGKAVPKGKLSIRDEDGNPLPIGVPGAIWYEGPNVMLGYAHGWEDLARGDDLNGLLDTGDVGVLGPGGHLTIVGRAKRFIKLHGLRINLDEIERVTRKVHVDSAVIFSVDKITVFVAGHDATEARSKILAEYSRRFTIPMTAFRFREVAEIPVTDRGKVDYRAIQKLE